MEQYLAMRTNDLDADAWRAQIEFLRRQQADAGTGNVTEGRAAKEISAQGGRKAVVLEKPEARYMGRGAQGGRRR